MQNEVKNPKSMPKYVQEILNRVKKMIYCFTEPMLFWCYENWIPSSGNWSFTTFHFGLYLYFILGMPICASPRILLEKSWWEERAVDGHRASFSLLCTCFLILCQCLSSITLFKWHVVQWPLSHQIWWPFPSLSLL